MTYRSAPHATADDPSVYIDPERVEEEQQRECVAAVRGVPRAAGVLDDERRTAVKEEALAIMRKGIEDAEDEPPGDAELVFAHAYAEPPAAIARDLDELRRVHGR